MIKYYIDIFNNLNNEGIENIISENKDNIQQKQINNVEIIDIITERFKNI